MNVLLFAWMIIKTILIILLCLIAFMLAVAALVLFFPVRYEVNGEYDREYEITVKAFWFFKLVRFTYRAENQNTDMELKAFGRRLIGEEAADIEPQATPENATEMNTEAASDAAPYKKEPESDINRSKTVENEYEAESEAENQEDNDRSLNGKIDKITKQCINAVEKVKIVIDYPDRDVLIELTLLLLRRWTKALRPALFRLEGDFGFEDPSLTGKCLGGLAMFCGRMGLIDAVRVRGNFEKKILVFTLHAKGRFTFWSFLWPLAAYISSKPVWKIAKPFIFNKNRKNQDI